eukprot:CAMPEP_0172902438 /NCGR_PEP_ID=MMETSP1075-20121228/168403_1 /TAXON_ID=2916 /ORGANISM="Ceratium fusus, Strain PA161109" /LENGTH=88 /DNA_ID=CAMNT_0013759031 /DNA_START=230 /DNA_END=496 /DNA_ORIENTATION=+
MNKTSSLPSGHQFRENSAEHVSMSPAAQQRSQRSCTTWSRRLLFKKSLPDAHLASSASAVTKRTRWPRAARDLNPRAAEKTPFGPALP